MKRQISTIDNQAAMEGMAIRQSLRHQVKRPRVYSAIRLWNTWTRENNVRRSKVAFA